MGRDITIGSEKLRIEINDAYKNGYNPKFIFRPPEFIPIPDQPERLNPETSKVDAAL